MSTTEESEVVRQFLDPDEVEKGGKKKFTKMKLLKRAFFLKVCNGPPIIIKPGDMVELHDTFLIDFLFYSGQAEPIDPQIPEDGEYVVRRQFQTTVAGEYKTAMTGQPLKLNRNEAIDLMRRKLVRPLDQTIFYIP